jgi:hypothetical protein
MGITGEKREERESVCKTGEEQKRQGGGGQQNKGSTSTQTASLHGPVYRRRETGGCLQRFESFRRRNSRTGRLMAKPFVGPTALIVNHRQGAADRPHRPTEVLSL